MSQNNSNGLDYTDIYKVFESSNPYTNIGKVIRNVGMLYETVLSGASIGSNVEFVAENGETSFGEVVSIHEKKCLIMPYEEISGINSNTKVYLKELNTSIKMCDSLLGRIVDFKGVPIDDMEALKGPYESRSIYGKPINPIIREAITEPLDTGISSINSFATIGKGQRISILAGSGVGKSILMGMISRNTQSDVNVIALIGERGREVLEFIHSNLGEEGLKKSIVIVATSDTSALIRIKAAYTATTIAEYFRDQGKDVLLLMDSLTRFAMAGREISLSVGEHPGNRGYSASVFARLPKLMERVGNIRGKGSITGIYTILVEGDDIDDPIADSVRAISDGHIVLTRELATKNHYPSVDILQSLSRVMPNVVSKEHRIVASHLRDLLAAYNEAEDLINVGAYVKGSNIKVDKAIAIHERLMNLLRQDIDESHRLDELYDRIVELAKYAEKMADPERFLDDDELNDEMKKKYNII